MSAIQLHPPFKLGRNRPPRSDRKRLLRFAKYVNPYALPAIPPSADWTRGVAAWPMLKNDSIGDCTAAAYLHMVQAWQAAVGIAFRPTDAQALALYSAVTGFNPKTGANDNGANEIDVLNYCRTTGVAGHKILAYAALNVQDEKEVKQAIDLFGGIYIGASMPAAWQGTKTWDANPNASFFARLFAKFGSDWTPGSWGGHCLSGDTKIALLDGTDKPIEELAGSNRWIYSMTPQGKVVPGFAKRIWPTGKKDLFRVYLDDGGSFDCTEGHPVLLRDGRYRPAGMLEHGQSLMPLYKRLDRYGYERVYDPATTKYLWTHRVVAEHLLGAEKGKPVHHADHNKRNNDPSNLVRMDWREHNCLHTQSGERRAISRSIMSENWKSKEWREKILPVQRQNGRNSIDKMLASRGLKRLNHSVVGVERLGISREVFDMEVPGYHNFALSCGAFVHNSVPIEGYDDSAENFTVVSWGDAGYRMTYKAFTEYVDEAYAIITTDFINAQTKRDPQGFDIAALQADLRQVTA